MSLTQNSKERIGLTYSLTPISSAYWFPAGTSSIPRDSSSSSSPTSSSSRLLPPFRNSVT
ncbi:MAG: hypothetical protein IJQ39_04920 [Thermoguttaceae bacterium]|nr:hypothetical protein [Thermoguttaceae bacterium]